jgi:hypothetical protein
VGRSSTSPQPPITGPAASRAVPEQTVNNPPRRSLPWYSRLGTRHLAVALVGLLVLGGGATYGVTRLTGDDGGDNSASVRANNDNGLPNTPKRNGAAVEPGDDHTSHGVWSTRRAAFAHPIRPAATVRR